MTSFLSRYRQGEREAVWSELRNLHATVRDERYFEDVMAVARLTMGRARFNVETLIDRLNDCGYLFRDGIKVPLSPPEKHPRLLSSVEQDFWTLGLSARAWIEVVGEVNLSGGHPQWRDNMSGKTLVFEFEQRDEFKENGPQYETMETFLVELVEQTIEIESDDALPHHIRGITVGNDQWYQCLDGVGWIIHRHEILVPDQSADATIDLEVQKMFFVDYLRHLFRWGGFPNFKRFGYQPHDEPIRSLTEDLLPI